MNISCIQAETGFRVDQVDHVKSVSATTWSYIFFTSQHTSVLVTLCLMSMKPHARSENPSHELQIRQRLASREGFSIAVTLNNAKHFSDCHGSGCKLSLEEIYLTKIWRILGVREWKESWWVYRNHLAVAVPKRKECHYVQQNWILTILHHMRRNFPASTGLCLSGF